MTIVRDQRLAGKRQPTGWRDLVVIEPRLIRIEATARFCRRGNRLFRTWDHLKPQLTRLVGSEAINSKLRTTAAMRIATSFVQAVLERREAT